MHDQITGVEVYIRPFGSQGQYTEYEVPRGSPLYTGNARERYIEAVNDERFEVVLLLHERFNFLGESTIQITCAVDGDAGSGYNYIEKLDVESSKTPVQKLANAAYVYANGEWRKVGFSFGEMKLDEHMELSSDQEATEVSKRARIQIKVTRGKSAEVKDTPRPADPEPLALTSTKEVVKRQGKSHSLKSVDLGLERPDKFVSFTPAKGEPGEPLIFTCYYASRFVVELKKILPTICAPIPAVESKPYPSPTPDPPQSQKRESANVNGNRDNEEVPPSKRIKNEPNHDDEMATAESRNAPITSLEGRTESRKTIKAKPRGHNNSSAALKINSSASGKTAKTAISLDDYDGDKKPHASLQQIEMEPSTNNEDGSTFDARGTAQQTPKIKSENVEVKERSDSVNRGGRGASTGLSSTAEDAKERKKAKIMLQLEEVKLKRELLELEE